MLFLFNDGALHLGFPCRCNASAGVLVTKILPPMSGGQEVWKFKEWLPLRMLDSASPPTLFKRSDGKHAFTLDTMVFYGGGDDVVAFLQALALALADAPSDVAQSPQVPPSTTFLARDLSSLPSSHTSSLPTFRRFDAAAPAQEADNAVTSKRFRSPAIMFNHVFVLTASVATSLWLSLSRSLLPSALPVKLAHHRRPLHPAALFLCGLRAPDSRVSLCVLHTAVLVIVTVQRFFQPAKTAGR
jgi:hypothetical protein